jgi:hypothetical protein
MGVVLDLHQPFSDAIKTVPLGKIEDEKGCNGALVV